MGEDILGNDYDDEGEAIEALSEPPLHNEVRI